MTIQDLGAIGELIGGADDLEKWLNANQSKAA